MRILLLIIALGAADTLSSAVAQDIPPERLYPLGHGDRWVYAVVESSGRLKPPAATTSLHFEDVRVVGDTMIDNGVWALVYRYVLDDNGEIQDSIRSAQRHDEAGNNYVIHELDCTSCSIGFHSLPDSTWGTMVGVGSVGYTVEGKGTVIYEGAALDGGSIDSYTSFASDIGLYHQVDDVRLADQSYEVIVTRLIYAEVSGLVYGMNPLPTEAPPGSDFSALTLDVMPNPSRGFVMLKISQLRPEAMHVEVFDVRGRLIHAADLAAGASELQLDVRGWGTGAYLVRVSAASGASATRRLVHVE